MIAPMPNPALEWRCLLPQEAPLAYKLYLQASANLPFGVVRPDTLATFNDHLGDNGCILGAFQGQQLLAYGMLSFQSELCQQLAEQLTPPSTLETLAVLDGAACHPTWRGKHLHQQLVQQRLKWAQQLGYQSIIATVSPHNLPSLRNLMRAGFCVQRAIQAYQGLERLLLLHRPEQSWQEVCRVAVDDFSGHHEAATVGLQGFNCLQAAEGWQLCYGYPQTQMSSNNPKGSLGSGA